MSLSTQEPKTWPFLLTFAQAAGILACSVPALRDRVRKGKILAVKVAGVRYVEREHLRKLIRNGRGT